MSNHILFDNKENNIENKVAKQMDSQGKVPKWLEDMSESMRVNRRGSCKISNGSTSDIGSQHSGNTSSSADPSPTNERLCFIMDELSLFSRDDDILSGRRHSSARYGRRAIPTNGTRSAGNSPHKAPLSDPLLNPPTQNSHVDNLEALERTSLASRRMSGSLRDTPVSLKSRQSSGNPRDRESSGSLRSRDSSDNFKDVGLLENHRNKDVPESLSIRECSGSLRNRETFASPTENSAKCTNRVSPDHFKSEVNFDSLMDRKSSTMVTNKIIGLETLASQPSETLERCKDKGSSTIPNDQQALDGGKKNISLGLNLTPLNNHVDKTVSSRQRDTTFDDEIKISKPIKIVNKSMDKTDPVDQSVLELQEGTDLSLEESWSSLNFFNKRQKGRLSKEWEGESLSTSESLTHTDVKPVASGEVAPEMSIDFIIPELPTGQRMTINVRSTWGDRHYLGLTGIEMFSCTGEPVVVAKIWAEPADINVLPEYHKDPRVVANLLDGVNRTHDDMHLWLAPFTPGANHCVHLVFQQRVKVAMIRIWNYNKSRIHSYRGARDVDIFLDGKPIFRGEIARACGGILGGTEAFGDTILFTTDDNILELISQFDESYTSLLGEVPQEVSHQQIERPITADNGGERPFTCARKVISDECTSGIGSSSSIVVGGQTLELCLLANWGHSTLIGLTGIEVIGDGGFVIAIEPHCLLSTIRSPDIYRIVDGVNVTTDESHMWRTEYREGCSVGLTFKFPTVTYISSIRLWNYNSSPNLSYCGVKLMTVYLDGKLVSTGVDGKITVRRAPGNCHFNFVQDISLISDSKQGPVNKKDTSLGAMADSYRLSVADGQVSHRVPAVLITSPTTESSKASLKAMSGAGDGASLHGRSHSTKSSLSPRGDRSSMFEDYEAPVMPRGFVFQLMILSTCGDSYYVGLNGLELYDQDGSKIQLSDSNIGAYPHSVNILEGVDNDVRTPERLIDGVNNTLDGCHMWLAPVLPNQLNRLYIVFDYPVTVSMIKLWNYAKTPSRGVKEFGILVDDLLVYNGVLDKVSDHPRNGIKTSVPYRTVLFTTDKELLRLERSNQVKHSSYGHNVKLLNNQQRVTSGGSSISADQSQRPLTSMVPSTRNKGLYNM